MGLMSWRLIIAILLCAAAASAWGGLQLGDWLIANGPTQIELHNPPPTAEKIALDANGKPYVASAPQPLSNGTQGVPAESPPVDWHVQDASLMQEDRPIALATTPISMDEAIAIASENQAGDLQGIAQIGQLGDQDIQPVDVPPAPPPPAPATAASGNWQPAFQAELKSCESLGFFSRPSCAWAARKKYCEPNHAWGRVEGCPAKKTGF